MLASGLRKKVIVSRSQRARGEQREKREHGDRGRKKRSWRKRRVSEESLGVGELDDPRNSDGERRETEEREL